MGRNKRSAKSYAKNAGDGFGAKGYGIRASINAAVAYDDVCSQHRIDIRFEPQAIIIQGRIPPDVVRRMRKIIVEVAGAVPVWDRAFWLG
jgi:hypothetical protein